MGLATSVPIESSNCPKFDYSVVDIFSNEERSLISNQPEKYYELQPRFDQFVSDYIAYYKARKSKNEDETRYLMSNEDLTKIRKKISVLIIVSSKMKFVDAIKLKEQGSYLKNAEDLCTAFLICHLFHNAFGISYEQMLITSTQKDDFSYKNNETILTDEIPKQDIKNIKFFFKKQQFYFDQLVNICQIGKKQYKFLLEEELIQRVMPFNLSIISNKLECDENSDLFVFFLDHGSVGKFGSLEYQFYIERLNQIQCKHYFVFKDSCYSTSLIELIKASGEFEEIFPDIITPKAASALFYTLSNTGTAPINFLKTKISRKFDELCQNKKFIIDNECKSEILRILDSIDNKDEELLNRLQKLINRLITYLTEVSCIPQSFTQFGQKATIFTSSIHGNIGYTLPCRKMHVFTSTYYRINGSIFSSVFIKSLISAYNSFDEFKNCIKKVFLKYRNIFQDKIIEQNDNDDKNNAVQKFFEINPLDEDHFFNPPKEWPDFSKIFIKKQFWNVDVSKVNEKEYDDIKLSLLKDNSTELPENPNNIGPIIGKSFIGKFLSDFEAEVNIELKKACIQKEFSISKTENIEKLQERGLENYASFLSDVNQYITADLARGFMDLKIPIATFFYIYGNSINEKEVEKLFVIAMKNILPFWNDCSLLC